MSETEKKPSLETLVSLLKRRGFVYLGSDFYGGLAGTYDFGPLGVELIHNIKELWWRKFVSGREDMYGLSSSILMPERVWRASGHLSGFADPMVECFKCKRRFRADHLADQKTCPECAGVLGEAKDFNLLFPVSTGATEGGATTAYLRGELAQGMFVNFKNILDAYHPKLPFGIAQIGRVFRNEISPRDFVFRTREFELAEFEYFVEEKDWQKYFEYWRQEIWTFADSLGLSASSLHELEIPDGERAHYSARTIDFEFDFPFGRKELFGLAYRGGYDLSAHAKESGIDLQMIDETENKKFFPQVIEPTFGLARAFLAIITSAYQEDNLGGEGRVFLKLRPKVAPIKVAVFPLLKNKPELVERARQVFRKIKEEIPATVFDDHGNIGKRYRRQDEIGTPWCVTIDFETLSTETVTLRERDSGEQKRLSVADLLAEMKTQL